MKKIIALLACLTLLTSCAAAEDSGFALLRKLYTAGENTVFSPLSLNMALGMAAEGANGVTAEEMLALLSDAASEEVKSANALFLAPDIPLRDAYRAAIDQKFAAEYFAIDENLVANVNRWVDEKTGGMIDKLMEEAPEFAGLILINAVAMEKDWENPFDAEDTCEEDFYGPDGAVSVQMMHQTDRFAYCEKDGVQIIRLPYKDSSLEMWIALPEAGGMEALLEKTAAEGLDGLIADAGYREVALSLPRADVTDENNLVDPLKALGMNTAFTADADFSGISDADLFIGSIVQKARIMMDEKSTSAAAATMVVMARGMMMEPETPVEMNVNRPYFFAVRDGESGAVCFTGVIENPAPEIG